jgi:uncharacterized NAD(P)/FAD-binding protein YdhS
MDRTQGKLRVAILGGGPSGLFMYKRLVESGLQNLHIDIFEATTHLGSGMPYSEDGANGEHVTNVSGNEIPGIVTPIKEWIFTVPPETLQRFNMVPEKFNDYKVLPRLLFGQYLSSQFELLKEKADDRHIITTIHLNSRVTDIKDDPEKKHVTVEIKGGRQYIYDQVIISTGHYWPKKYELTIPGYFDSPYPPSKLRLKLNHPVAVRGASLTAIDAIRTLARQNGSFSRDKDNRVTYTPHEDSPQFRIVMHSRNGLLPAIRFHFEDTHLSKDFLIGRRELNRNRAQNEGFLSLDYIFEKDFMEPLAERDPKFHERVKDMSIEEFVAAMMDLREKLEPFQLFKAEYVEAEKSIRRHESIYWKELLAILSFAMNYPAKHLSAEDMQRLQKVLMPLISIVIAFVPQSSCEEMIAMHDAGRLELIPVGTDSHAEPDKEGGIHYHYIDESGEPRSINYATFVDCVGQPHLAYEAFPFKSLLNDGSISPARLQFRSPEIGEEELSGGNDNIEKDSSGNYYLRVPGIRINDSFQVIDTTGHSNPRIYIMAVPFIGGFNPDYSGLDFCEEASSSILKKMESVVE